MKNTHLVVYVLHHVVLQRPDGILDAQVRVRPQQRFIRGAVADQKKDASCTNTANRSDKWPFPGVD